MPTYYRDGEKVSRREFRECALYVAQRRGNDMDEMRAILAAAEVPAGEEQRDILAELGLEIAFGIE